MLLVWFTTGRGCRFITVSSRPIAAMSSALFEVEAVIGCGADCDRGASRFKTGVRDSTRSSCASSHLLPFARSCLSPYQFFQIQLAHYRFGS